MRRRHQAIRTYGLTSALVYGALALLVAWPCLHVVQLTQSLPGAFPLRMLLASAVVP